MIFRTPVLFNGSQLESQEIPRPPPRAGRRRAGRRRGAQRGRGRVARGGGDAGGGVPHPPLRLRGRGGGGVSAHSRALDAAVSSDRVGLLDLVLSARR